MSSAVVVEWLSVWDVVDNDLLNLQLVNQNNTSALYCTQHVGGLASASVN